MKMPTNLVNFIGNYLSNRSVSYTINGEEQVFSVERGVTQESVLGPCLWNGMYNRVLELLLPKNVQCIAFADNLTVVATAKHGNYLSEKSQHSN